MKTVLYWFASPLMWLTGVVLLKFWDHRITASLKTMEFYFGEETYDQDGPYWVEHLKRISYGLPYEAYRRIWMDGEVHGKVMSARHGFGTDMVTYFQMTYFYFHVILERVATAKRVGTSSGGRQGRAPGKGPRATSEAHGTGGR